MMEDLCWTKILNGRYGNIPCYQYFMIVSNEFACLQFQTNSFRLIMVKQKANCFCQGQTNKLGSDSAAMVFTYRAIDSGPKASSSLAAVTKPSCVCKLQPFIPPASPLMAQCKRVTRSRSCCNGSQRTWWALPVLARQKLPLKCLAYCLGYCCCCFCCRFIVLFWYFAFCCDVAIGQSGRLSIWTLTFYLLHCGLLLSSAVRSELNVVYFLFVFTLVDTSARHLVLNSTRNKYRKPVIITSVYRHRLMPTN